VSVDAYLNLIQQPSCSRHITNGGAIL